MCRMSRRSAVHTAIGRCLLAGFAICLIFSITPGADLDSDGSPDLYETGCLILGSAQSLLAIPTGFVRHEQHHRLIAPASFTAPLVPPPVL